MLLPNGSTCNNASRPIQCTRIGNGFELKKLDDGPPNYSTDELGYKCCLPYSCDNDSTDIIVVNILGK